MSRNAIFDYPHLSASGIGDYIDCSLMYKFSRVMKLPPQYRADAFEFGSVIHKVLSEYYEDKREGFKRSLEQMLADFEMFWSEAAKDVEDIKYKEGKDYETLLSDGRELLKTYYKHLPENGYKVIGIEEPFSFNVEGISIPLVGFIDLIEEDESGAIIITDHKTSSKSYSSDEIDKSMQMTLYHMALKSMGYADREILLRFDVLIKTKITKFEEYYTSRTELDERRITKKISCVWDGICRSVFVPNDESWKCKGCQYKTYCDEWLGR